MSEYLPGIWRVELDRDWYYVATESKEQATTALRRHLIQKQDMDPYTALAKTEGLTKEPLRLSMNYELTFNQLTLTSLQWYELCRFFDLGAYVLGKEEKE